jgi:hypothetical protein
MFALRAAYQKNGQALSLPVHDQYLKPDALRRRLVPALDRDANPFAFRALDGAAIDRLHDHVQRIPREVTSPVPINWPAAAA